MPEPQARSRMSRCWILPRPRRSRFSVMISPGSFVMFEYAAAKLSYCVFEDCELVATILAARKWGFFCKPVSSSSEVRERADRWQSRTGGHAAVKMTTEEGSQRA